MNEDKEANSGTTAAQRLDFHAEFPEQTRNGGNVKANLIANSHTTGKAPAVVPGIQQTPSMTSGKNGQLVLDNNTNTNRQSYILQ